jgi:hypothetical protein
MHQGVERTIRIQHKFFFLQPFLPSIMVGTPVDQDLTLGDLMAVINEFKLSNRMSLFVCW